MNNKHSHARSLVRALCAGILFLCFLFALELHGADEKPGLPAPVEKLIDVLFEAAEFDRADLSPDGSHLAYVHEVKGVDVLDTYAFKTRMKSRLAGLAGVNQVMGSRLDQSITDFDWLGADQLVVYSNEGNEYYSGLWLTNGSLATNWRVDTKNKVLIVANPLAQNPQTAILRESGPDGFYGPLWCLNKKSRSVYLAEQNPGRVIAWDTDVTGAVRLAVVAGAKGQWSYLYRDDEKKPWRPLPLPAHSSVVTFDASGRNLLLIVAGATGRRQLQQFSLDDNKLDPAAISDPIYDVDPEVLKDTRTGTPVGLRYEGEKQKVVWLSGQYADLSKVLEGSFPGRMVSSIGVLDDNTILFGVYADTAPFTFYRYDPAKREISLILSKRPEAGRMKWAPMTPISFPARDGYVLHGYLTLPLARTGGQKVPLIALSHGGPVARDEWGFNREVQFFAALGYAVLQVNYRGSSGYGVPHELKNAIEVAEKSVDDVVDGIRWSIDQGVANPKKIVAYGGSYGGYISLGIATRYPELPVAVVGFAGVYDWEREYVHDSSEFTNEYNYGDLLRWRSDYYLDPRKYAEGYRAVSPVHFAGQVRCPVMLHHGGIDHTVEIGQTNAMAAALRKAGKSVELTKDPEGVHGFANQGQSKSFYRNLAAFLAKNAPPDKMP